MTNRDLYRLAFAQRMSEWRIGVLAAQPDLFADVFKSGVAKQGAGEQASFTENLESIADAQHQPAGLRKLLHGIHNWSKSRDGAGAKVVAIGEATGDDHCVTILKIVRLVP